MLTTMASLGAGRDSGSPLPLPLALTTAERRHYHLHPSHHHHHHHHHHQLLASPYDPIRRLALARLPPPRRPVANKPFTSFCIKDILGGEVDKEDVAKLQAGQGSSVATSASKSRTASKSGINKNRGQTASGNIINNNNNNNNSSNSSSIDRTPITAASPSHSNPPNLSPSARIHVSAVSVNGARIVRPWAPSPSSPDTEISSDDGGDTYQDIDNDDDDDEEISVDDDEPSPRLRAAKTGKSGVSPLDALMAMTSKTFEGLETPDAADARRRDQAALFGKHAPPKKRRKSRTAFTNQQIYELEKRFLYQKYLTPADRDEIAHSLGLTNAQVITWFQNRRAKLKRDLEELKNDVTAARKHPVHKALMGTMAELQLRKVHSDVLKKAAAAAAAAEAAEGSGSRSGERTLHVEDGRRRDSAATPPPSSPSSSSATGPSPSPLPLSLTTCSALSPSASCHSNSSASHLNGGCLRCGSTSPTAVDTDTGSKLNSSEKAMDASSCADLDSAAGRRFVSDNSPQSLDGQEPESRAQEDMDTSNPTDCEGKRTSIEDEERDKASPKTHDS